MFLKPNIYTSFIRIYFSNAGAFLFSFVRTDYKTSWKAKAVRWIKHFFPLRPFEQACNSPDATIFSSLFFKTKDGEIKHFSFSSDSFFLVAIWNFLVALILETFSRTGITPECFKRSFPNFFKFQSLTRPYSYEE